MHLKQHGQQNHTMTSFRALHSMVTTKLKSCKQYDQGATSRQDKFKLRDTDSQHANLNVKMSMIDYFEVNTKCYICIRTK